MVSGPGILVTCQPDQLSGVSDSSVRAEEREILGLDVTGDPPWLPTSVERSRISLSGGDSLGPSATGGLLWLPTSHRSRAVPALGLLKQREEGHGADGMKQKAVQRVRVQVREAEACVQRGEDKCKRSTQAEEKLLVSSHTSNEYPLRRNGGFPLCEARLDARSHPHQDRAASLLCSQPSLSPARLHRTFVVCEPPPTPSDPQF